MDIAEARDHYRAVVADVRARVTCDGEPLDWAVDRPEEITPVGALRDDGTFATQRYRGPLLYAARSCSRTAEEFRAASDQVRAVLEEHGGVADTQVLADGSGSEPAEVRWRDEHGGTVTFGSREQTTFSVRSAELPSS